MSIGFDLSALDGLAVAGYPLATLLIWATVAGLLCLSVGIIARLIADSVLLLYLGAGILISVGVTYLVNVL